MDGWMDVIVLLWRYYQAGKFFQAYLLPCASQQPPDGHSGQDRRYNLPLLPARQGNVYTQTAFANVCLGFKFACFCLLSLRNNFRPPAKPLKSRWRFHRRFLKCIKAEPFAKYNHSILANLRESFMTYYYYGPLRGSSVAGRNGFMYYHYGPQRF
jgi:hypothetical protein